MALRRYMLIRTIDLSKPFAVRVFAELQQNKRGSEGDGGGCSYNLWPKRVSPRRRRPVAGESKQ